MTRDRAADEGQPVGARRLDGKVVLLSGTAGGQGRVTAELFARHGAKVVGCDIDGDGDHATVASVAAQGGHMVSASPLDLTDPRQARQWVDFAIGVHGRIDVLYNNASFPAQGGVAELSHADWDSTIRNELDLVWHCSQAVWPHFISQGRGTIVNIGSIASRIGRRGASAHAAAKGGVAALTRQLAADGAGHQIRVNCLSPGAIDGPALRAARDRLGHDPVAGIVQATAMGREGQPLEVAYAGLFLASDESSYVTGIDLVVDGGASVLRL